MAVLALVAVSWGALPGEAARAAELQFRAGTPSDRDGDGVGNALDADDDNDLIADDDEPPGDADGDGVPNAFDVDADNDGVADLLEATSDASLLALIDADGDGLLDAGVAIGENGLVTLAESVPGSGRLVTGRVDSDGDGVRDPYDLDSDDDGLTDVVEAGGSDADGDGRVDRFRDLDGDGRDDQLALFPIVPRDTDGDGLFDFRDRDSDGDGASDRLESSGVDTDGDGVIDGLRDDDGDGLDDGVARTPVRPIDSGGDSRPDHLDPDTVPVGFVPMPTVPPVVAPPVSPPTAPPVVAPPTAPPVVPEGDGAGPDADASLTDTGPGRPVTGRAGNALGGCSIGDVNGAPVRRTDPSLVALLLLALGVLAAGRSGPRSMRRVPSVVATSAAALVLGGCSTLSVPADLRSIDGFHAGVALGASRLDADTDGTAFAVEERGSSGVQLTLGATLAPWLDAEVRASDLGELSLVGGSAIGYQVLDVGAVARRDVGRAEVFARAGLGALFNDGGIDVDRRNDVHLLLGGGVDVPFAVDWRVRLEASGHDVDALQAGIGLVYRFGRRERRAAVVATAPTDVPAARERPAVEPIASRAPTDTPPGAEPRAASRPTIEPLPRPDIVPRTDAARAAVPVPSPRDTARRELPGSGTATASPSGGASSPAVASLLDITPLPDASPASVDTPSSGGAPLPDIVPRRGIPASSGGASPPDAVSRPDVVPIPDPSRRPDASPRPDVALPRGVAPGGDSPRRPDVAALPDIAPRPDGASAVEPAADRPSGTGELAADSPGTSPVPAVEPLASSPDAAGDPASGVLEPSASSLASSAVPVDGSIDDRAPVGADVDFVVFDVSDYELRFEPGSERLTAPSRRAIESLAAALNASPDVELSVVTRSTPEGDEQVELLSRRRALAVVRALDEAGVDISRVRPEVHLFESADADGRGGVELQER